MSLMDALPCLHCGDGTHSATMHEEMFGKPEPTPVGIQGTVTVDTAVRTNEEAADYGAYSTYAVTATDSPIRILGHDDARARAVITVDVPNVSVWVGKREQIYSNAPGILVTSTSPATIRNKQEVWMAPNGDACNVSVLNERWEM